MNRDKNETSYERHTRLDHEDILSSPNGVDHLVECKDCNGLKWLFLPGCLEPLTIYPNFKMPSGKGV